MELESLSMRHSPTHTHTLTQSALIRFGLHSSWHLAPSPSPDHPLPIPAWPRLDQPRHPLPAQKQYFVAFTFIATFAILYNCRVIAARVSYGWLSLLTRVGAVVPPSSLLSTPHPRATSKRPYVYLYVYIYMYVCIHVISI